MTSQSYCRLLALQFISAATVFFWRTNACLAKLMTVNGIRVCQMQHTASVVELLDWTFTADETLFVLCRRDTRDHTEIPVVLAQIKPNLSTTQPSLLCDWRFKSWCWRLIDVSSRYCGAAGGPTRNRLQLELTLRWIIGGKTAWGLRHNPLISLRPAVQMSSHYN